MHEHISEEYIRGEHIGEDHIGEEHSNEHPRPRQHWPFDHGGEGRHIAPAAP